MKEGNKQYDVYKKVKLLGEGSYGKAFLVESKKDKVDIQKMSEEEKQSTVREAKIMEALKHPNIIGFREVYKNKRGELCIVMDYADGGDLQEKLKSSKGKQIPENQILNWFTQICLAIKHLHDRKIIHRDLKAGNIFLTTQGRIKMGDFGISRVLSHTREKAKTMVGTPYYLAPEIVQNQPYGFAADVWSLGVLAYEMCTLKPPFDAGSLHALALKIVNGKFNPLPGYYSSDIRTLIGSMLQTEPRRRPTINKILRSPIMTKRIKDYMSETLYQNEFSHTILHRHNIFENPAPPSTAPVGQRKEQVSHPPEPTSQTPPGKVNYHYQQKAKVAEKPLNNPIKDQVHRAPQARPAAAAAGGGGAGVGGGGGGAGVGGGGGGMGGGRKDYLSGIERKDKDRDKRVERELEKIANTPPRLGDDLHSRPVAPKPLTPKYDPNVHRKPQPPPPAAPNFVVHDYHPIKYDDLVKEKQPQIISAKNTPIIQHKRVSSADKGAKKRYENLVKRQEEDKVRKVKEAEEESKRYDEMIKMRESKKTEREIERQRMKEDMNKRKKKSKVGMDFELVHPDYQEKVPTEEKKETPKLPGSDQFKQYRKEARKKFKKAGKKSLDKFGEEDVHIIKVNKKLERDLISMEKEEKEEAEMLEEMKAIINLEKEDTKEAMLEEFADKEAQPDLLGDDTYSDRDDSDVETVASNESPLKLGVPIKPVPPEPIKTDSPHSYYSHLEMLREKLEKLIGEDKMLEIYSIIKDMYAVAGEKEIDMKECAKRVGEYLTSRQIESYLDLIVRFVHVDAY